MNKIKSCWNWLFEPVSRRRVPKIVWFICALVVGVLGIFIIFFNIFLEYLPKQLKDLFEGLADHYKNNLDT